ncbi:hypothetical protein BGW37DRAFT_408056, partial [Umbelopsis sp. PMI_123]
TIYNPATASAAAFTLFQPSSIMTYNQHQPMLGQRHSAIFSPQRSRSNSVHSKPGTVASEPETESDSDAVDDMDDPTHLEDDQSTASESEDNESEEDESDSDIVSKVVAKIKNGTIMNGKGEFVNKTVQEPENEWREEAKINRKVKRLDRYRQVLFL